VIVLDTNVLSEPLRARPDANVLRWFQRVSEDVALTSITVGEVLVGVRALPTGKRREGLMAAVEQLFASYADRVLAYDEQSALTYASLLESRRTSGRPLSVEDGMIAAICRVGGHALATRNTKDFEDLGVILVNPWTSAD
jgi:predicted nucleic acid-binding protein